MASTILESTTSTTGSNTNQKRHYNDIVHINNEEGVIPKSPPSSSKPWRTTNDESNLNPGRRRKQLIVLGVVLFLVLLGTIAVVVPLVLLRKDDNDQDFCCGTALVGRESKFTLFAEPATVQWQVLGQVILDPLKTTPKQEDDEDGAASLTSFPFELAMNANGTRLVVGREDSGYVHMFDYYLVQNNTLWYERSPLLKPPEASDSFGHWITLSGTGDRMAIGSAQKDDGTGGSAYTYKYQADTDVWKAHGQTITAFHIRDYTHQVGLSLDGNVMAVASYGYDGKDLNTGLIRIYERTLNDAWALQDRIMGTGHDDKAGVGLQLSADGTTVASANSFKNTKNGYSSGIIWVWRRQSNNDKWRMLSSPILGPHQSARLGYYNSMDLSDTGNVVAAYAPGYNRTGALLVYEYVPTEGSEADGSWQMRGEPIVFPSRYFASVCLAADGDLVFVGSGIDAAVYQYDSDGDKWIRAGSFEPGSDNHSAGAIGWNVACSRDGRTIAIGDPDMSVDKTTVTYGLGKVTVWRAVEPPRQE